MKLSKNAAAGIAALLSAAMLLTGCSGSALSVSGTSGTAADGTAAKNTKEETVYVMMKPDGSTDHILVSNWIVNGEKSQTIEDQSDLKDIANVGGDQTFSQSGEKLTWAAGGADIQYQGSTDKTAPVAVAVSYKLDGKAVTADQLAGKSGSVTITFSFTNNAKQTVKADDGTEQQVTVPFLMLTAVAFDNDHFSNVRVSDGKLVNDGDRTIAVGYALPGLNSSLGVSGKNALPESVTFTADAKDFALDTALVLGSNEVFSGLDFSGDSSVEDLSNSLAKLKSGVTELVAGSDKLYNGSSDLYNALSTLSGGLGTLTAKNSELNAGAAQMADAVFAGATTQLRAQLVQNGMSQTDADSITLTRSNYASVLASLGAAVPTAAQITQARAALSAQLSAAGVTDARQQALILSLADDLHTAGTCTTVASAVTTAAGMAQDAAYVQTAVANLSGTLATDPVLGGLYASLQAAPYSLDANTAAAVACTAYALDSANPAGKLADASAKAKNAAAVQTAQAGASDTKVTELATAAVEEQLAAAGSQLNSLKVQLDQAAAFVTGVADYTAGVASASSGSQKILTGAASLRDGLKALNSGLDEMYSSVLGGLSDFYDGDIGALAAKLNDVSAACGQYTTFTDSSASMPCTVRFVYRLDSIG